MAGRTERAWRLWPAALGAVWLGFAGWLLTADTDARATTVVVDVIETVVPLAAGIACMRAARRSVNGSAAWALAGSGVLAWGLGQLVWTWYEVVLEVPVPFPSLADVGYLAFPVLASLGLATYLADWRNRPPLSAVLDGALVAASLFVISWFVVLRELFGSGSLSTFEAWLSMAYPVGDVILATMVLHVVVQLRVVPPSLWLLSTGLITMAVADSGFVWMLQSGGFATGGWIDVAWISAFALIGLAGVRAGSEQRSEEIRPALSRARLVLPYALLTAGMAFIAGHGLTGGAGRVGITVGLLMVALVLARQYVLLADNQSLLASLRAHQEELQHLALHDPLTGLANRALLADRLARTGTMAGPATLLLVDLDDFKVVNDVHGHAAGDALLVTVGVRLTATVRASDTVARLGGDEFAILLEPTSDGPDDVAQRVIAALAEPFDVAGFQVQVSGSVGVGRVPRTGADAERSSRALHEADLAMYMAKSAGKNRWRRYVPGTTTPAASFRDRTLPEQAVSPTRAEAEREPTT